MLLFKGDCFKRTLELPGFLPANGGLMGADIGLVAALVAVAMAARTSAAIGLLDSLPTELMEELLAEIVVDNVELLPDFKAARRFPPPLAGVVDFTGVGLVATSTVYWKKM